VKRTLEWSKILFSERRGIRATDQKALNEGTTVFTNEKHIPMKDRLVTKNRGGKTRKLRNRNP